MNETEEDASTEETASNRPRTPSEARDEILASLAQEEEAEAAPKPYVPPYVPLPVNPPDGMAWVRIKSNFPIHVFVIPSHELKLTQTEWTEIAEEQLTEIEQVARENQILLEVYEPVAQA
jgi:hypothetical protein